MGLWTILQDKKLVDIPALCCDVCGDTFFNIIKKNHNLMRLIKAGIDEQHAVSYDSCTAAAFVDRLEKERQSALAGDARKQSVDKGKTLLKKYNSSEVLTPKDMEDNLDDHLILTHTEFWNRREMITKREDLKWGKQFCYEPFVCTECYNDTGKMYAGLDQTFNDAVHVKDPDERYRNYVMASNVVKQRRFMSMRQPTSVTKDTEYTVFGYIDPYAFKEDFMQADKPAVELPMDRHRYVSAYIIEPYFVEIQDEAPPSKQSAKPFKRERGSSDDESSVTKRSHTAVPAQQTSPTPRKRGRTPADRPTSPSSFDDDDDDADDDDADDDESADGPVLISGGPKVAKRGRNDDKWIVSYDDFCTKIRDSDDEELTKYFAKDTIACVDVCVRGFSVSLVDQQPHQTFIPSELVCGPHCGYGPWRIPDGTAVICDSHADVVGHFGIVKGMKRVTDAMTYEVLLINHPSVPIRGMSRINTLKLGLTPVFAHPKRIHDEKLAIENNLPLQESRALDKWHFDRGDNVATFTNRAEKPLKLHENIVNTSLEHNAFDLAYQIYDLNDKTTLIFSSTLLCEAAYNYKTGTLALHGLSGRLGFKQAPYSVVARIENTLKQHVAKIIQELKTSKIKKDMSHLKDLQENTVYILLHTVDDKIEESVRWMIRSFNDVTVKQDNYQPDEDTQVSNPIQITLNFNQVDGLSFVLKRDWKKKKRVLKELLPRRPELGSTSLPDETKIYETDVERLEAIFEMHHNSFHADSDETSIFIKNQFGLGDMSGLLDTLPILDTQENKVGSKKYELLIKKIVSRLQNVSSAKWRHNLNELHAYLLSRRLNAALFKGDSKEVVERSVVYDTDIIDDAGVPTLADPLLALQQDLVDPKVTTTVQNAANYLFAHAEYSRGLKSETTGSRTIDSLIGTVLRKTSAKKENAFLHFDRSTSMWPLIQKSFIASEFCLCVRDPGQARLMSQVIDGNVDALRLSEEEDVKQVIATYGSMPTVKRLAESSNPFSDDRRYWLEKSWEADENAGKKRLFTKKFLSDPQSLDSELGNLSFTHPELIQIVLIAAAALQSDANQSIAVKYESEDAGSEEMTGSWIDRARELYDATSETLKIDNMPPLIRTLIRLIRVSSSKGGAVIDATSEMYNLRWNVASQVPIVAQIMRQIIAGKNKANVYAFSGDIALTMIAAVVHDELCLHRPNLVIGTTTAFVRGWKACVLAGSITQASHIQDMLLIRITDMFNRNSTPVRRRLSDAIDRNVLRMTSCAKAEHSRQRSASILLPAADLILLIKHVNIFPKKEINTMSHAMMETMFSSERCSTLNNVYELRRRLLEHSAKLQSHSQPTSILTYSLMLQSFSYDDIAHVAKYLMYTGSSPNYSDDDIVSTFASLVKLSRTRVAKPASP